MTYQKPRYEYVAGTMHPLPMYQVPLYQVPICKVPMYKVPMYKVPMYKVPMEPSLEPFTDCNRERAVNNYTVGLVFLLKSWMHV